MNLRKRIDLIISRDPQMAAIPKAEYFDRHKDKALLIIDMDYSEGWSPDKIIDQPKRQSVATSLKKTIAMARRKNIKIVFVIYNSSLFEAGQKQFKCDKKCSGCICCKRNKLAEFLEHRAAEPIFIKNNSDAFTNTELTLFLRSLEIRELLLCGCYTNDCVMETAKGAVKEGFNITLLNDAIYPPFYDAIAKEYWLDQMCRYADLAGSSARIINDFLV